MKLFVSIFLLSFGYSNLVSGQSTYTQKFSVNSQLKVMIESPDNFMTLEIYNNANDSIQLLTNYNIFETDNPILCTVADYNFDGNKDFSLSYEHEGNTWFHIFLFNPLQKEFVRLYTPNSSKAMCNGFSNITIDSQKKRLLSTCKNEDNEVSTDVWIITADGTAEYAGKKK